MQSIQRSSHCTSSTTSISRAESKRTRVLNWAEKSEMRTLYDTRYKDVPLANFQPIHFIEMRAGENKCAFDITICAMYMEHIEIIREVAPDFAAFMEKYHFTITAYRDEVFAKINTRNRSEPALPFYRELFPDFDNYHPLHTYDALISPKQHIKLWEGLLHVGDDSAFFVRALREYGQ